MRLTLKDEGISFDNTKAFPYVETYTQPLHNYIIARIYHYLYEGVEWKIRKLFKGANVINNTRCYDLHQKNKIQIKMSYGHPVPIQEWKRRRNGNNSI